MSKPVIQPIQSVLEVTQGRRYEFQPYAINGPSGWSMMTGSTLPPGGALNTTTGRIRGPFTSPGVYNFALRAHNFDGESDPMIFTIGVTAGPIALPADIQEINIDIPSQIATMGWPAALGAYTSANPKRPAPIMFAKRGDIKIYRVRFWRGDTLIDVPVSKLVYAIKNLEPERTLVESDPTVDVGWKRTAVPEDDDVFYTIRVPFTKEELRAALQDEETDDATFFIGIGEITWEFTNITPPVLGDGLCRTSTQSFGVALPRDIIDEVD